MASLKSKEVFLDINIKDRFATVYDFDNKLSTNAKANFVKFYRSDSRKIEAAKRKVKRNLDERLEYYSLKYSCVHGGKPFKTAGCGRRKRTTIRNLDMCQARIKINLTKAGNEFEVVECNNIHNHQVDSELFHQLPSQRKLRDDLREEGKRLMKLKGNKHLIREQLQAKSSHSITLRNLTNLSQQDQTGYNNNNIESAVKKIKQKFKSDCYLLVDDYNHFRGMFYCSPTMRNTMRAYPEFICFDATSKLLNFRVPLYIILVEDGNGESEVVAVGILTSDDHDSLMCFFNKFKEVNSSWIYINSIMADKDLNEKDVLKESFPESQILIFIFHVLKNFQREITNENMKITAEERRKALTLLQNLIYSHNDEEFDEIKQQIEQTLSKTITDYLENHWYKIYKEWCPFMGQKVINFMNSTNNRLEGINSKLKAVISKNSTIEEFLEHLFVILESLQQEKKIILANLINKRSTTNETDSTKIQYKQYVTDFAFKHIESQLNNKTKYELVFDNITEECRITHKWNNSVETHISTKESCDCYFFKSMGLPCHHIFALLKYLQLDLFQPSIVIQRWTKTYMLQNQTFFKTFTDKDILSTFEDQNEEQCQILSQQDKYNLVFMKWKTIASLSAKATEKKFEEIVNSLNTFIFLLENNSHFIIQEAKNKNALNDEFENQAETPHIWDDSSYNINDQVVVVTEVDETYDDVTIVSNDKDPHEPSVYENYNIKNEIVVAEINEDYNNGTVVLYEQDSLQIGNYEEVPQRNDLSEKNFLELGVFENQKETPQTCEDSRHDEIVFVKVNEDYSDIEADLEEKKVKFENNNQDFVESNQNNGNEVDFNNVRASSSNLKYSDIKMPPVLKKRGIPMGSDMTVIGLPKKRKKPIVPFNKL